jgi:hypothetical protein
MTKIRRRARSTARVHRRLLLVFIVVAVLCTALILVLWVLPGGSSWNASVPMRIGDMVAGPYRTGVEASKVKEPAAVKTERDDGGQVWDLESVTLRFASAPLRLTGADIRSAAWPGPRGLCVGDTLESLYQTIPVTAYENAPEDLVLLYAAGITSGGLPKEPYAAVLPSGDSLLVRIATQVENGAYAICDVYVDPDTDLIQRIRWEVTPSDGLLERK